MPRPRSQPQPRPEPNAAPRSPEAAAAWLRTLPAVRERCEQLFALAEAGELAEFGYHPQRMAAATDAVVAVIRRDYPHLDIPLHSRWRHFAVGGVDRMSAVERGWGEADPLERARRRIDLAVVSVLLDAGAGPRWRYTEAGSGATFTRSEGLAVASLAAFAAGAFSSDPARPAQVDGAGLGGLTADALGRHFQVSGGNPLAGFEGRLSLLHRLGKALMADPATFGAAGRPGHLLDGLQDQAVGGRVALSRLWDLLMTVLADVWPAGRTRLGGEPLGDVWPHPALGGGEPGSGLVPFHKLTQWLTYSLLEPITCAGLELEGTGALTGLAEYRNGGLFVDLGVISPRQPDALARPHDPGDPLIVAWRALTVALLDRLAGNVREALGAPELSLGQVLQGGTWQAGREAARRARPGGDPPFTVVSDGTLF